MWNEKQGVFLPLVLQLPVADAAPVRIRICLSRFCRILILSSPFTEIRGHLPRHSAPSHEQVDPDPRYGSPSVSEAAQSQGYGSPDQRYGDSDSEIRGARFEIRVSKPETRGLRLRDTGAQTQRHGGAESEIRVSRPETRGFRLRDTGTQTQRHRGSDSETQGLRLRVRGAESETRVGKP
jgi:hypothetical protein